MKFFFEDIIIIGSFPPPNGGISIHLKELCRLLEKNKYHYKLYNTVSDGEKTPNVTSIKKNKILWYLEYLLYPGAKINHMYSVNWYGRLLFGVRATFRKGMHILSIHGRSISIELKSKNVLKKYLTKWLLSQMDLIITCNDEIKDELLLELRIDPTKVYMIPAFIQPQMIDNNISTENYQKLLKDRTPILFSVGWIGKRYLGEDVYGFDMLIELVKKLKPEYPDIILIISINGGDCLEMDKFIKSTTGELGSSIYIIKENLSDISFLYNACDIFIRPTNTDGDSVSIREALFYGVPVVTSNVVPRPNGCEIFENRNVTSLEKTVRNTMENLDLIKRKIVTSKPECNGMKIIDIYRRILGNIGVI